MNSGNTDTPAKARHLRIAKMIAVSVIVNTLIFSIYAYFIKEFQFFYICLWFNFFYVASYLLIILGFPNIGRQVLLISGNLIIFYGGCLLRGEANIQIFFFSLSISPFFFFSWEERKNYFFSIISVVLFMIGEFYQWNFFEPYPTDFDMKYVRLFAILATLFQIITGFYYFLKLSVKYETENSANLKKLEIEHQKQIQAQKMSSLGEMAGGISHEINNPLMIITGKTYNLRKDLKTKLPENDITFANLEKIELMVKRISKIISALRNFARNSEHDPAVKTDVNALLDSTLDLCRERFTKAQIALTVAVEDGMQIMCRPSEISQVLLNLLNNAYDAVSAQKGAKVSIHAKRVGQQLEIVISDNGPGVDPAIADKIMQPFYTTKEIGKGTGLGLSISKGIIESHQGTLVYVPNSKPTTFQILLPIAN